MPHEAQSVIDTAVAQNNARSIPVISSKGMADAFLAKHLCHRTHEFIVVWAPPFERI